MKLKFSKAQVHDSSLLFDKHKTSHDELNLSLNGHEWIFDPADYRTIDGTGNNEVHPEWGSTNIILARTSPEGDILRDYADGLSEPSGGDRPSARVISNALMDQSGDEPNSFGASDFLWVWGQFLDHDIDLTLGGGEPFDIEVPLGDPYFDPFFTGTQVIHMSRSGFLDGTGPGTGVPGEQINGITSFIDASQVYGSYAERAEYLRDPDDMAKLRTSEGDFLPYNLAGFDNAPGPFPSMFLAGDVRANENIVLTSMHTLFMREHNRLVDELADQHPNWDAEHLYQEARMLVGAEIQAITYNEYLPVLLGEDALAPYTGYNPDIDASIANIFATAAFRFGHSQLSSELLRIDENGNTIDEGNVLLRDAFFNPDQFLNSGGPDALLRGVAEHTSQTIDLHMIDDVRNFLFGPPGSGGFDLASLNIQRGRDHGLPDYNTAREAYGLDPVTHFSDISSDTHVQDTLETLFGSVDNIDVFVGGLAEDLYGDAMVGELFYAVLVDQFTRLRDGDSFFYQNHLSDDYVSLIEDMSLADIVKLNTGIEAIQDNLFYAYSREGGTWGHDVLHGSEGRDLLIGGHGHDELYGYGGNDHLESGLGNDILMGGLGNDVLVGGPGVDYAFGGEGADIFRYSIHEKPNGKWAMDDGPMDYIQDFNLAEGDLLQFEADFGFDRPNLGDITHMHTQGDDLVISFEAGGKIILTGMDPVADIEMIASVDMV